MDHDNKENQSATVEIEVDENDTETKQLLASALNQYRERRQLQRKRSIDQTDLIELTHQHKRRQRRRLHKL